MKLYLVLVCVVLSLLTYAMNIESMSVKQNEEKSKLIIGGIEAKPGEFPYQVVIENKSSKEKDKFECGGVIIDDRHVLTTARCVTSQFKDTYNLTDDLGAIEVNSRNFKVRAGAHNRSDWIFTEEHDIERVIYHNYFGVGSFNISQARPESNPIYLAANDIALLKTKKPINLGLTKIGYGSIDKINLPKVNITYAENEISILAGWGVDKCGSNGVGVDFLQKSKFKILPEEDCLFKKGQKRICAKGLDGSSFSRSDRGSGLVRIVDGHYELVGLVSHPMEINQAGCHLPATFTRVESYLVWIHKWIKSKF